MQESEPRKVSRTVAMRFVVALGIVSLFSDAAYEGARAIIGAYMAQLGATSAAVGLVAGGGELFGYLVRALTGPAADRTRRYWTFTGAGYLINLGSIPAMGLVGSWPALAGLVLAERTGKAVRTPARDAMLSEAAEEVGTGWGFGIHEALDQVGAAAGPLFLTLVLALGAGYSQAFLWLGIPVALALASLGVARLSYPRPKGSASTETHQPRARPSKRGPARQHGRSGQMPAFLDRKFAVYLVGVALAGAGLADFALIAFHAERAELLTSAAIPLVFAFAMGVDGVAALGFGRLFDRIGLTALSVALLVSAPFAAAAFSSSGVGIVAGTALWGIGLGAQESIMRSGVAVLVPREARGSAYGLLGAVFGVSWFLGSAAMGVLYQHGKSWLVGFSVFCELAAAVIVGALGMSSRKAARRRLEATT